MFKLSVLPVLALLTGHTQILTKMDLFKGSENVGHGTYEEKFERNGHKTSVFDLITTDDRTMKVYLKQTKVIDNKAFPLWEHEVVLTVITGPHPARIEDDMMLRFDDTGAALLTHKQTINKEKQPTTERSYLPPPGYSRADPSDLWFSKVTPLPGTTVTSTVFDIEQPRWFIVETTFVGKKWITVGGRQIQANEVKDIRDGSVRRVYLDDKGQPVLMKHEDMRTEKHF